MAGKEVATMFFEIRANFAKFQVQMGQLDKSFQAIGKTAARTGKLFSATVTAPLTAIGGAAIVAAKSIDDAFDTIRASTGATGAELAKLQGSFESVFGNTTQGAEEVASAIGKLNVGLGLTGEPLEGLTTQVSKLATVTNSDLGGVVKSTIAVMNSWQVSSEDQSSTLDYLFKVSQKTGVSFEDLSDSISSNQPTFKALGLDLKGSAALLGQLGKAGASSSDAVKALSFAVSKFAKAGVKDMAGAFKTAFQGIKNIPSDTEAAAAAMQIFGNKAGPKFASLIRSGKISYEEFVKAIEASPESIDKVADATSGFSEKFAEFRNQLKLALAPIGMQLLDGMSHALTALKPLLKGVSDLFKFLGPNISSAMVATGAIVASIGPAIYAFSFMFGWVAKLVAIGPLLTGTISALGGAFALLISPIGLVAAALAAMFIVWYKWDVIGPMVDEQIQLTIDAFNNLVAMLGTFSTDAMASINAWIDDTIQRFQYLKDTVLQSVADLVNGITQWFTGGFEGAKTSITGFADDVTATFQGMYDTLIGHSIVPDMVSGISQEMQTMGTNMVTSAKEGTSGVSQSFSGLLQQLKTTGKEGAAEGKKLAESWKQTGIDLKSVMSDVTKSIDPMRQQITGLLKAGDFAGLDKMAQGFRGNKEALDQFRSSLKDGKGDYDEWIRNSDQLNERLKETQADLYELSTGKKYIDPLTQSVVELMQAGDMNGLKALGESMQNTAKDSRAFEESLSNATSKMREMKAQGAELASSLTSGVSDMMKSFGIGGDYADFFGGIFGGAATGQGKGGAGEIGNLLNDAIGNLFGGSSGGSGGGGGIMDSIMSSFGFGDSTGGAGELTKSMGELGTSFEGLGDYASIVTDSFESLSKIGKTSRGTAEGLSQGAGATIGAIFGGSEGAKIGSTIGKVVGKVIGGTFGGTNKETLARKSIENYLEDAFKGKATSFYDAQGKMQKFDGNFKFGDVTRFDKPGWADKAKDKYGAGSTQAFDTLGKGLTNLLGVTEDVGGQIGAILQENLVGNLDNARMMIKELGISQEDMVASFEQLGESGSMSWHEVEVNLQQIPKLFGEGLAATGDLLGGFNQIVNSAGDGMDAIYGVKNAAVEAGEAGVKSFAQWKQSLLNAGADPAYVDAFFKSLESRGLTTLDSIKDASTRTLGSVIAGMESNSAALAAQWQAARAEASKYMETVASIPDNSEKNVRLNVTANLDAGAQQVLDMQPPAQTPPTKKFAKGGVVNGPTMFANGGASLGLMGEAGPEAIMPLARIGGKLGVNVQGSGKASNVYNIDARGAAPGVEKDIMRALAQIEQRAVESALVAVADARDRGGNFSDSF